MPDSSFWSETAVPFTLAYYSLTVAMTVYATLAMIIRILLVRKQYQRVLGSSQHTAQYLGIVAMLIESSALYTVWACIFLALYIHASPIQYVFLGSLAEVQIISPLLIIFRCVFSLVMNITPTDLSLQSCARQSLEQHHASHSYKHRTKGFPSRALHRHRHCIQNSLYYGRLWREGWLRA